MYLAPYPLSRPRRMRQDAWSRNLMQETRLHPSDLILPLFVVEGQGQRQPISSLPGIERYSVDVAVERAKTAEALGIPCVAIFPCVEPSLKTEDAREAWNPNNLACRAIKAIKQACPNLGVMVDVALDLYTTHGHDGLVEGHEVVNDKTVEALIRQSLCFAAAGVDALGPSDMMDGRIRLIRKALEEHAYPNTRLFSYSAKYASALYGPYRDAVGSGGNLSGASKATYQQDPANTNEALREAHLDISEGADMLMVKPASYYLDVIHRLHTETEMPVLAYQVSGEYAMIQAAAQQGWIDGPRVMDEALLSMKRAGACGIISYASLDVAQRVNG
jgi:porphobilinogen synthase